MERVDVAIVGGGQAGLGVGHELAAAGIDHLILERGRVGQTWRDRWDTFCLVTPNWTIDLPGLGYAGEDPNGFMPRDELVGILEGYARHAPVREGVEVTRLDVNGSGFVLQTTDGALGARAVVASTGAYQRTYQPPAASSLPRNIVRVDANGYTNEATLPDGDILIVGSGQTGCQLAEELHEAGRRVVLSCGKAPWVKRRYGDRDIVWWLVRAGFFDAPVGSLPSPQARLIANPLATGHGGGHDLHLRTLHAAGVTLAGRFIGADGEAAVFAPDLAESVAWGDARHAEIADMIRGFAARSGEPVPEIPEPEPFDYDAPERLSLDGFGAVIFTGGFRPDYGRWIPWERAFDDMGFPIQRDGASTVVDGLFFAGVHFLRTRKSALLMGTAEDADAVAKTVAAYLGAV